MPCIIIFVQKAIAHKKALKHRRTSREVKENLHLDTCHLMNPYRIRGDDTEDLQLGPSTLGKKSYKSGPVGGVRISSRGIWTREGDVTVSTGGQWSGFTRRFSFYLWDTQNSPQTGVLGCSNRYFDEQK